MKSPPRLLLALVLFGALLPLPASAQAPAGPKPDFSRVPGVIVVADTSSLPPGWNPKGLR